MNNCVFKRKTTPIKFRQNNDVEMSEHYKRTRRPTDQKTKILVYSYTERRSVNRF